MDLNRLELIGRLTKDPLSKKLPSGQKVVRATIATNYSWTDVKTKEKKETVDFHSIVVWGKLASIVEKYLVKGSRVFLTGRLAYRSWDDKKGEKKYITEIIAKDLIMLDSKKKTTTKEDEAVEDITIEEVPVEKD